MTGSSLPAEAFPVRDYIEGELLIRKWTTADLARAMGVELSIVDELMAGTLDLHLGTAVKLGRAFGTSGQVWINLQNEYRRWEKRQRANGESDGVE